MGIRYLSRPATESQISVTFPHPTAEALLLKDHALPLPPLLRTQTMDRDEVEKMQTRREKVKGAQEAKRSRGTSLSVSVYVQIPTLQMHRHQRASGWLMAEDRSWLIEVERAATIITVRLKPQCCLEMLTVCRQCLRHA